MGYQVSDQDQSGTHSNNTAYVGNGVFGPLLRQLANQYGTQQAAADLIFGGKQYGKARTYLPDQYRDMTPAQGQSLNNAEAIEQQSREMPSYKGADGTIWTWDKKGQVYIGYQKDKGEYTKKVGAWSPWDKENTTPPWKTGAPADPKSGPGTGLPPSPPPTSGGGPVAGGSGVGGQSGGGSTNPPGSSQTQGDVNPQTGRPWGVTRRVPGVGRADEQGLTGLGVRTESPTTQQIQDPGPKGSRPQTETETQEFGRRFGQTPTGLTATYDPQSDNPFDPGDPGDRNNWNTSYDPRPSNERLGKSAETSDLASQHPATFQQAMDRIGESGGNYYKDPNAFKEPFAGGEVFRQTRKPEEEVAEQTFAKLLSGLRR